MRPHKTNPEWTARTTKPRGKLCVECTAKEKPKAKKKAAAKKKGATKKGTATRKRRC